MDVIKSGTKRKRRATKKSKFRLLSVYERRHFNIRHVIIITLFKYEENLVDSAMTRQDAIKKQKTCALVVN